VRLEGIKGVRKWGQGVGHNGRLQTREKNGTHQRRRANIVDTSDQRPGGYPRAFPETITRSSRPRPTPSCWMSAKGIAISLPKGCPLNPERPRRRHCTRRDIGSRAASTHVACEQSPPGLFPTERRPEKARFYLGGWGRFAASWGGRRVLQSARSGCSSHAIVTGKPAS
jgi:hypothetical protein